jgi:hypothetical protein
MADTKTCTGCHAVKPIDEFHVDNSKARGRVSQCRACQAVRRANNREAIAASKRRYRERHPERIAARTRAYQAANADRLRAKARRWRYGITADEFDARIESQGGGCAICRTPLAALRPNVVHVDHDHDSQVVRGILCGSCNRAIGALRDDPDLMRRAAAYVESGGWVPSRGNV